MLSFKRVYTRLYDQAAVRVTHLHDSVRFVQPGSLEICLTETPEVLEIASAPLEASTALFGGGPPPKAPLITRDQRYQISLDRSEHMNRSEFWITCIDQSDNKVRRLKLNTEWSAPMEFPPRIALSPDERLLVSDDGGVVRLHSFPELASIGSFQIAHPETGNNVAALSLGAGGRFLAGLSTWKNIVLYNLLEQRVVFVRQIQDSVGWYQPTSAYIMLSPGAEVIVTVGMGQAQGKSVYSVNAFRATRILSS